MNRRFRQSVARVLSIATTLAALFNLTAPTAAQNIVLAPPTPGMRGQSYGIVSGPRGPVPYMANYNGMRLTLPVARNNTGPSFSRQSGLQLTMDFSWPGQYGYRPVIFTLTSRKPFAADQSIEVEFTTGDWAPPRGKAMSVRERFTFPAGATSVTETVLCPRFQDWQLATWRIKVDGVSDDFLGVNEMHLGAFSSTQVGLAAVGIDLTSEQQQTASAMLQAASNGSSMSIKALLPTELPTDWLGYSSLDVVILPAKQFADLTRSHPQQMAALRRWVRAGGTLWLLQAGDGWRKLPEIEQAIGWTKETGSEESLSEEQVVERGWKFARTGERSIEPSQGALLLAGFDTGESNSKWSKLLNSANLLNPADANSVDPTSAKWFAIRGLGLGVVTAFPRNVPTSGTPQGDKFFATISQSLVGPRLAWPARHGNQPDTSNDEFNNLLIPGVGVAPVGQFQFLITLFAVVIGPLNYWLLKRGNRLPMLLATVPAAAAITTALLFTYGLLADGFEVRARARTLTLLDQQAGEASSWGRLSYYAGISPRHGLSVPKDQAMYPIIPSWGATRYGRASSSPREVVWDDQQRLTNGWLASRTPTQYHAITVGPTDRRLELRATDKGLRIVNRLGVDVRQVGVEDHDGKFYWCEELPVDAATTVPATDHGKLTAGIRQQFTANIPEAPGGDDFRYRQTFGREWSQSLMEGRLEAINDPGIVSWGRGKYIAFTKQALGIDLGLEDVAEEMSFHVIEGTW